MGKKIFAAIVLQVICMQSYSASVYVSDIFQGLMRHELSISAMQAKSLFIDKMPAESKVTIILDVKNKYDKNITACVIKREKVIGYKLNEMCAGVIKGKAPYKFSVDIVEPDQYYLILDNRYSLFTGKDLLVNIVVRKKFEEGFREKLRESLQSLSFVIDAMFENADIDLYVEPCGESNAYSENKTANITICTELFEEVNSGSLAAVILHEYGHSLLNRWGEPGSSEEDMADQFATALLLQMGDSGRQALWNR